MKGWMYILECSDESYYVGSTIDLELRIIQHQSGNGANHTKKRLPVKLIYFEEFYRIDNAFYREKQVQGWSRKKKEALMKGETGKLIKFSKNYTEYGDPDIIKIVSNFILKNPSKSSKSSPLTEPVEGNKYEE